MMLKPIFNMAAWSFYIIASLTLAGCSAGLSGILGGVGSATAPGGLVSSIDNLVPELVLQKYQALHNLKVGMQAIDASPGPVTMVMQPPAIVTPGP